MKHILAFYSVIILLVTMSSCASWSAAGRAHPYIGSETEKLLKNAAETIDFDIGYNHRYDITYMFRTANTGKPSVVQERELMKILNSASKDQLVRLYDAVLKIHQSLNHKAEYFKKRKIWKDYTYCKNYLLPPTEEFSTQLKKALVAKDPSFAELEKQMTPRALSWARWYYRYAEEPVDTF